MEKKICFGFLGNGITVWTSVLGNENSDPTLRAHISPDRKITYYQDNTPKYFRDAVEEKAQDNMTSQGSFCVLNPKNKPTKYVDTRFYGRILICEEFFEGEKHYCTQQGQIVDDWKGIQDITDDKREVYFVGNLQKNKFGEMYGDKFGFSFSKETANEAVEAIKKWENPCWRNAVVMPGTTDDLSKCGRYGSIVNLDWKE